MSEGTNPCAGCQWLGQAAPGDYCYMFAEAPIMLPCTQHDKFAETREMLAAIYKRHPGLLTLAISGMIADADAAPPIPT